MRYQKQRVLVTGGAGFIGSFLTERLLAEGAAEVVVFDNFYRGRRENLSQMGPRMRLVEGDLREPGQVNAAMEGMDVVFHLAAQSQVRTALAEPHYCFSTNVMGTFHVLEAAKATGVRRLVFASSREVYGEAKAIPVPEEAPLEAKNGYGLSKVAGELYCRQYAGDFEVAILRLSNVYGPRDFGRVIPIFVRQALEGKALTLLGGKQVCDFVDVGTVVEMFLRVGVGPVHGPLNVGSGIPVTLVELAERILALTGATAPVVYQPEIVAEVAKFVADTRRAQDLLGLPKGEDALVALSGVIDWLRQELSAQAPVVQAPAVHSQGESVV